jgi:hypothetical protein
VGLALADGYTASGVGLWRRWDCPADNTNFTWMAALLRMLSASTTSNIRKS